MKPDEITKPTHKITVQHVAEVEEGQVETVPRTLDFELRGNELYIEPKGCGVHYILPFDEVLVMTADSSKGYTPDPVYLERMLEVDRLESQLETASVRQFQAESKRDDTELRVQAVVEWSEENGLGEALEPVLGKLQ